VKTTQEEREHLLRWADHEPNWSITDFGRQALRNAVTDADLCARLAARVEELERERDAYKTVWELACAIPGMTDAQLAELRANALAAQALANTSPHA
jgi:hypothetical protein